MCLFCVNWHQKEIQYGYRVLFTLLLLVWTDALSILADTVLDWWARRDRNGFFFSASLLTGNKKPTSTCAGFNAFTSGRFPAQVRYRGEYWLISSVLLRIKPEKEVSDVTVLFCLGKCNMSITGMPKIQCSTCFCFYQSLYISTTFRGIVILCRLLRQLGTFRPGLDKVDAQMVTYFARTRLGAARVYTYIEGWREGGLIHWKAFIYN